MQIFKLKYVESGGDSNPDVRIGKAVATSAQFNFIKQRKCQLVVSKKQQNRERNRRKTHCEKEIKNERKRERDREVRKRAEIE